MLETILERIRLYEVMLMSSFQNNLSTFEPIFMFGSNLGLKRFSLIVLINGTNLYQSLGDPLNGYIFFFVFCFIFVSHSSAFKILWTSVLSEWINLVLKWLFNDQRPYWWSQMAKNHLITTNKTDFFEGISNDYDFEKSLNSLNLKQFAITCESLTIFGSIEFNVNLIAGETGPGFPSGHVMCSAAVWFCLIIQLIKYKILKAPKHRLIMRFVFISSLLLVSLGRIYISAHFPDQCFVGLITGIIVAVIIEKLVDMQRISFCGHLVLSILLIAISYSIHEVMNRYSAKSADWSLNLAKTYCFDINNVRADTSPLYVIWRCSGTVIGIGIVFNVLLSRINKNNYLSLARNKSDFNVRLINTIVSTVALIIFVNYSKPEATFDQIYSFYLKSFVQFMFIPIVGFVSLLFIDKIMKFYLNRVLRTKR